MVVVIIDSAGGHNDDSSDGGGGSNECDVGRFVGMTTVAVMAVGREMAVADRYYFYLQ